MSKEVTELARKHKLRSWVGALHEHFKESGLTVERLSKLTKIPEKRLKQIFNGRNDKNVKVMEFYAIGLVLGLDITFTVGGERDSLADAVRAALELRDE